MERDTRDIEAELEVKLREERERVQDVISEQIDIRFKVVKSHLCEETKFIFAS